MAQNSPIEWTDKTWNPIRGCSRVSPGCGGAKHEGGCYAEKIAARFSGPGQPYEGLAVRTKNGGRWTGHVRFIPEQLETPLHWKKPQRIFVNSMSDLFHENVPDEVIDKIFAVMALCPQHTFQVLTKRSDRMRSHCSNAYGAWPGRIFPHWVKIAVEQWGVGFKEPQPLQLPLPNVWLGVSVEDQQRADERIPDLLATPAAVRFLSCEPLIAPVSISHDALQGLDWVICGGESGMRKRPTDLAWHRSLRDQCAASGVAFYEKQVDKIQPIPDDLLIRQFPQTTGAANAA